MKMKAYYTELQKARSIKFQPYVSVVGIGTLGTDLVTPESKLTEKYVDEKLGKILQNDCKNFFDHNEVFESNGLIRTSKVVPIEDQRVYKDVPNSNNNSEPSSPKEPPPGFEPVGSSFSSFIFTK